MSIEGKVFMFTGALSVTRSKAQQLVEERSGIAGSSVTRDTDYLVVGDIGHLSNKLAKATEYGIKQLTEEEFWALLKESEPEEDYSGLKGIITEEVFSKILAFLQQPSRLSTKAEGKAYPPIETMSYYSQENLDKFTKGNKVTLYDGGTCCHCGHGIPYSINRNYLYCFFCLTFTDRGQTKGRHFCAYDQWEKLDIPTENGFYRKCKVCGNVDFVGNEEVDSKEEGIRRCNFVHSAEFCAEVNSIYRHRDKPVGDIAGKLDPYERQKLQARFESWAQRHPDKL